MPSEINVKMSYDTPHSYYNMQHSQSIFFCLKFRFHYIRDVQGSQVLIASYPPQNPPTSSCFPCSIHPRLIAHPDPSLLCSYLHNYLNFFNPPNLNHTSRLNLSRTIANSLKSTLFRNFCQATADVEIVDVLILDGNVEHDLIHQPRVRQTVDGDVLILDGNVEHNLLNQPRVRQTVDGDVGESRVDSGGTGASKLAMNMLMKKGCFQYHNNGAGEDEECSICWESYRERTELIKMPCLHIFHKKCIFQWLKTKNSCPLCRQKV